MWNQGMLVLGRMARVIRTGFRSGLRVLIFVGLASPAAADGFALAPLTFGNSLGIAAATIDHTAATGYMGAMNAANIGTAPTGKKVAKAAKPAAAKPAAAAPAPVPGATAEAEAAPETPAQHQARRAVSFAERQEQSRRRTADRMAKTTREVPIRVEGVYVTATEARSITVTEAELQCLADTLYFEARGESSKGQAAVAEVILNRVDSGRFPGTICGVVKQGSSAGCQFSYNCGKPRAITDRAAYARVKAVAKASLAGPRSLTDGATYFHTPQVRPSWSHRFVRTVQIDNHIFYRPGVRVASN